mmetsp:Transcript_84376/g.273177  ORF Transcript_84376/g.273177 Transcript_84376/m.273177 type:complete len:379 (+) Transcript_84376:344-1480(+)
MGVGGRELGRHGGLRPADGEPVVLLQRPEQEGVRVGAPHPRIALGHEEVEEDVLVDLAHAHAALLVPHSVDRREAPHRLQDELPQVRAPKLEAVGQHLLAGLLGPQQCEAQAQDVGHAGAAGEEQRVHGAGGHERELLRGERCGVLGPEPRQGRLVALEPLRLLGDRGADPQPVVQEDRRGEAQVDLELHGREALAFLLVELDAQLHLVQHPGDPDLEVGAHLAAFTALPEGLRRLPDLGSCPAPLALRADHPHDPRTAQGVVLLVGAEGDASVRAELRPDRAVREDVEADGVHAADPAAAVAAPPLLPQRPEPGRHVLVARVGDAVRGPGPLPRVRVVAAAVARPVQEPPAYARGAGAARRHVAQHLHGVERELAAL